jgi:hypothetical protein
LIFFIDGHVSWDVMPRLYTGGSDSCESRAPRRRAPGPGLAPPSPEDAEGVAAGQELVGGLVVERDDDLARVAVARIDGCQVNAAVLTDVLEGVVDDTQVPQPQEVHLDQPHIFATGVVEAGDLDGVLGPHVQQDPVGSGRSASSWRG